MKGISSALFNLTLVLLGLTAACANPRPPTGGPRDETPPTVAQSRPVQGAVNVSTRSVQITFSEYVNQGAFANAFSISPTPPGRLEFNWSGRTVTIRFPEPLRDNTTYVINLSTDLSDNRGVELSAPITLAFATGPRINKGRLSGRVVDAVTGQGLAEYQVYAYAAPAGQAPDSLPARPAYITQTTPEGSFQFEYLNEQPYFVIALNDANRNRLPDPGEGYAVPPEPALPADTVDRDTSQLRWLATSMDTIPPQLQRVRPLSSRRLELQFDEPVLLDSLAPSRWSLRDSLQDETVPVRSVFALPQQPTRLFLLTDSMRAAKYLLTPAPVSDSSGMALSPRQPVSFTPLAAADTVSLRFRGFLPNRSPNADTLFTLYPREHIGLRFSEPVDTSLLRQAVTLQDTLGTPRPFTARTSNGTTYRLQPDPPLGGGGILEVHLDMRPLNRQDTTYTQLFRRLPERELGSLSGVVTAAADSSAPIVVELLSLGDAVRVLRRQRAGPDGRFLFERLPERQYGFRAFVDRRTNMRWDGGQIMPYRDAEPLTWTVEPLPWRARWENVLGDTLRIPAR